MPPITISPGADIHLVVGMTQVIVAHAYLDTGERDIAADPATSYNGFGAAVTLAGATFTGVAVGDVIGVVNFTETVNGAPVVHSGYLRIRVHAALEELWIANDQITIRAGESDYVATVWAKFDDLAIADVTGHDWLTFKTTGTAFTLPGFPNGRIAARAGAAGLQDLLRLEVGTIGHMTLVHVGPAVSEIRPIIAPVRYHAPHQFRRNILFLAEGYPDKSTFEEHVLRIVDIVFTSPVHSPYRHLRERFNIWTAFEEPPTGTVKPSGVTFGPSVTAKGAPLP
jgi:hypothetical protein